MVERCQELKIPTITLPLSHIFGRLRIGFILHLVRLFPCLPYLLYLLSHFPVRVIHLNTLVFPDAAIAELFLRCKTIWHIREPRLETLWGKVLLAATAALSHTVIANSKFTQNRILSSGVKSNRVAMIYKFNNKDPLRSDVEHSKSSNSHDDTQNDLLIGYVGRVSREKGRDIFVQAAIELAQKYQSLDFLIVGSLDDQAFVSTLSQSIDDNHMTSRIRFTGVQDDIATIMRGLNVHVTPSRWDEPFGRVAMEVMAFGAVSVVSDRGGLPEIVEDATSGLVFQAKNPADLIEKLDRLIGDQEFRHKLCKTERERALEVFPATIKWQSFIGSTVTI